MNIDELITKYNLPNLESLESELEHLKFDKDEDTEETIIKELITKLREKIEKYISFLEDIIQPDSSLISLQESNVFSDVQREEIFIILKKIIFIQRSYFVVDLNGTFNDKINYFKLTFNNWQILKKQVEPVVKKSISVWQESVDEEVKQNYFG